jgi:hypothetical protein
MPTRTERKDMHGEIMVRLDSNMNAWREEMKAIFGADRGKTEATDSKANPEDKESEAVHREVPKDHVAVKLVGGLRTWHRGQNLAAKPRRKSKNMSRRKLATASRGTTRSAKEARLKGNVVGKIWTRDNVTRRTSKGQTLGWKRQPKPESKYGIMNRRLRQQLQSKRKFAKIYRKTTGLEIARRIARYSVGMQTLRDWTSWRGQPPPKSKKRPHTE